jgi:hypothetical protein
MARGRLGRWRQGCAPQSSPAQIAHRAASLQSGRSGQGWSAGWLSACSFSRAGVVRGRPRTARTPGRRASGRPRGAARRRSGTCRSSRGRRRVGSRGRGRELVAAGHRASDVAQWANGQGQRDIGRQAARAQRPRAVRRGPRCRRRGPLDGSLYAGRQRVDPFGVLGSRCARGRACSGGPAAGARSAPTTAHPPVRHVPIEWTPGCAGYPRCPFRCAAAGARSAPTTAHPPLRHVPMQWTPGRAGYPPSPPPWCSGGRRSRGPGRL